MVPALPITLGILKLKRAFPKSLPKDSQLLGIFVHILSIFQRCHNYCIRFACISDLLQIDNDANPMPACESQCKYETADLAV